MRFRYFRGELVVSYKYMIENVPLSRVKFNARQVRLYTLERAINLIHSQGIRIYQQLQNPSNSFQSEYSYISMSSSNTSQTNKSEWFSSYEMINQLTSALSVSISV